MFLNITIPLPPLPEQTAIAKILSTQDRVIELKEQLLAEKKRQKKYLMQQLLTGKMRLKGFKGEWREEKFDNVFCFCKTNTLSREYMSMDNGTIKNIHYGDILTKYGEILDVSNSDIPYLTVDEISCEFVNTGDVIIADTAEDLVAGKVVEIRNADCVNVVSGLHTFLCRPKLEFYSGWLGYYMNSEQYHNQLIPLISGIKVMSISKSNIINTYIRIPSTEEQEIIVNVLETADREIELIGQSIEAEKRKKKSLMQLLLTGIVRVGGVL